MPNPFVCGVNGFQEDEDSLGLIQCSASGRSSRKGKNSNPFSTRGLDKFNKLLADLDEKKQKLYSKMGSDLDQDNSLVRFVYSSSNDDVVPIVIRLNKDGKHVAKSKSGELVKEKVKYHHSAIDHRRLVLDKSPVETKRVVPENGNEEVIVKREKSDERPRLLRYPNWRRPSFYMPVAIVLILLFLAFFGRSVAILCTSIGWYLVPTLSSTKPSSGKKDRRRGTSEIKMVNSSSSSPPPRSSNNSPGRENGHRQSDHRKSF